MPFPTFLIPLEQFELLFPGLVGIGEILFQRETSSLGFFQDLVLCQQDGRFGQSESEGG